jgi:hypothetical protein
MSRKEKLLLRLLTGTSDANFDLTTSWPYYLEKVLKSAQLEAAIGYSQSKE